MANIFLQDVQVADRYGVGRVSVWRWVKKDPTFPKPFKLSPGTARWRLADLEAWEAERFEGHPDASGSAARKVC